MHRSKRWNIAPPHPAAEELASRLKTSPLIAQILLNRGISEADDCRQFLRPSLKCLHDPMLLPNLDRAAQRIARAIRDRQKIVIYGDYDVDGITATAILWHAIRTLGGAVDFYVPHRLEEGYGLNSQSLRQICDDGANLIVTVDCGITALEPARIAAERGVDLIITDHHEWRTEGSGFGVQGSGEESAGSVFSVGSALADAEPGDGASGPSAEAHAVPTHHSPSPGTPGEGRGEGLSRSPQDSPHPNPLPAYRERGQGETVSPADAPRTPRSSPLNPEPRTLNPRPLLPACYAIVHPRLPTSTSSPYPNPALCGAGVAFKLAWGIGLAMSGGAKVSDAFRAFLLEATALAALGTIADVVSLLGENRVLAHYGLGGLRASKLVGIKALIASAALTGQNLDSFHVGFLLAPRLNASGRMGHARLAIEMLTTDDEKRAMEIASYLEKQNRERQTIERQILDQAIQQIADNHFADDDRHAIVLGAEGWHAGVIGIVASRIVERYHRPTVMIALTNGHGQGSARSIAGFHLAHALEACAQHLETHGGHEMAAGLKLETARLGDFREAFCAHAKQVLAPEQLVPAMSIDCIGEVRHMTHALVADLNRLGPFGPGNRRPMLACRGVTIAAPPRRCGRTGDHLQLLVKQGEQTIKCIAFNLATLEPQLQPGTIVDLAVEPTINEFNGRSSVELEVKDLQFTKQ